jgi:hypothetical protein
MPSPGARKWPQKATSPDPASLPQTVSKRFLRKDLEAFLPTPRLIKEFDAMSADVTTVLPEAIGANTDAIGEAQADADAALIAAAAAQAAADAAQADADAAQATADAAAAQLAIHEADTSVHGVTGDVVGTTDAQTLSNKTLAGALATDELVFSLLGKGVSIKEGANARMGAATLVAGAAVVNTTAVTATSRIFLTGQNSSGTHGELTISARVAGVSFTITSANVADTRSIAWMIVNPSP